MRLTRARAGRRVAGGVTRGCLATSPLLTRTMKDSRFVRHRHSMVLQLRAMGQVVGPFRVQFH